MWPQVKPTQHVFFIQCLTIWGRLFNSVHDHKRTVTALTTIHRHNRRASHKILEWWSWYRGGTRRRQNLCALVAEFGRMKSDVHVWVILNVKGRNSPSSLLLTYLFARVNSQRMSYTVETEAQSRNPDLTVHSALVVIRSENIHKTGVWKLAWLATHSVSSESEHISISDKIWGHIELLSACSVSPCHKHGFLLKINPAVTGCDTW